MDAPRDLAEFLAEAGAVVGGSAAFGATLGFLVGSVARDLGRKVDPMLAAESGGRWGGVLGIVALGLRLAGV